MSGGTLMPKQKIPFSKRYDKLAGETYTTIRGPSYKTKIGGVYQVLVKGTFDHHAKVVEADVVPLSRLPLEFLQKDTSYNGVMVESKDDFIAQINKYWHWAPIDLEKTPDPKFTVIHLKKTKIQRNLLDFGGK
jgi:hypothetical protein